MARNLGGRWRRNVPGPSPIRIDSDTDSGCKLVEAPHVVRIDLQRLLPRHIK